jgi:hypothetical protein
MNAPRTVILDVEDLVANGVEATAHQLLLLSTVGQAEIPIAYTEGDNIIAGFNSDNTLHLVTHKYLVDAVAQMDIPRIQVMLLPKEQALLFANN